jgi:DNA-binding NtrC family response regulator
VAERRYSPLGGEELEARVRFIAVGSEDLPRRVAQEAFRADLFYRLEVLAFRVPPLRERRADLPAVLDHLLADLGERFGRSKPGLAPRARAWMLQHPWPGNLRQLRNTLERGLILAAGGPVDPPQPEGLLETRPRPLLEVEKEQIRNALAYTRGHQGRAAELLGISRKALWEKRRRYGIP